MGDFVFHLGKLNLHLKIRDEVDQSVFNEIFRIGEYRSAESAIKEADDPIIDAGAHIGFFSIYCRALNPKVEIFAVEPESRNLSILKAHIKENKLKKIKVVECALSGITGNRNLVISDDSHNHHLGDETGITVSGFTFKDFCKSQQIKNVSVLKMDVEGAEYEIFKAMDSVDFAMVKFVILEYHKGNRCKEIEMKLRENGYGVQIFPSKFDKTMGFLWAKNKRLK